MTKRGWAKIVQPLKSYKNKYMTQWLIGIFVHFISSKDDLINCAGVGRLKRFGEPFQLFYFTEFFLTPFFLAQFCNDFFQLGFRMNSSHLFDNLSIFFK